MRRRRNTTRLFTCEAGEQQRRATGMQAAATSLAQEMGDSERARLGAGGARDDAPRPARVAGARRGGRRGGRRARAARRDRRRDRRADSRHAAGTSSLGRRAGRARRRLRQRTASDVAGGYLPRSAVAAAVGHLSWRARSALLFNQLAAAAGSRRRAAAAAAAPTLAAARETLAAARGVFTPPRRRRPAHFEAFTALVNSPGWRGGGAGAACPRAPRAKHRRRCSSRRDRADVAAYTQQTETDAAALEVARFDAPSAARAVCSSRRRRRGLTAQSSTHLLASAADAIQMTRLAGLEDAAARVAAARAEAAVQVAALVADVGPLEVALVAAAAAAAATARRAAAARRACWRRKWRRWRRR